MIGLAVAGFSTATAFAVPATATTSPPTWYTATAYPAPSFTPARTIDVYSKGAFWAAWKKLQPGDRINVHGVAFTGESVFSKQLSDWAEVHFDSSTTFTGAAGSNVPAVWIKASRDIRFYGGDVTNPSGGAGITIYDSSYVTWWDFTVHDTANAGLFVQGINAANDHLDLKGEISHWGLNLALDPHAEKGTGIDGADLAGASYGVRDSRFALYVHDGATGSGVQAGGATSTDGFWNNTLYLWCQNLTMQAVSQVAGNCAQIWGVNTTGNTFAYLEAENLQGRAYDANGLTNGQSLASDSVAYGRAANTNLNPHLAQTESTISPTEAWDPRGGTIFTDVGSPPVTTTTATTTTGTTTTGTTTTTTPSTTTTATTTTATTTTQTTTTQTTTTPTTTTVTTTPSPGAPTWSSATSYAAPSFTPLRTIDVSTKSAFWTAWNAIQPGDEIDVHGVAFTGESVFNKQLSGWAEVHFDSATTFTGAAGSNLPAAWIKACSHIRFYGGDVTNPNGGSGITIYDSSYFTWWGFTIHDTANTGLFVQGINTAVDHVDLKGEISHWGLNLALDPHTEKGTGMHGANLADANYGVKNSRFALYLHDGATGSGVEAGGAKSTDGFWDNTLYLWCQNLTMQATSQVAGNCAQIWGENDTGDTFPYLEAENLQGRPYDANGVYSGQLLTTDSVAYGRASNTNLNPYLSKTESAISATLAWDPRSGTIFTDVLPH